jgi:replication initiation protein RepC
VESITIPEWRASDPQTRNHLAACGGGRPAQPSNEEGAETGFPLRMVLEACPDLLDCARDGIASWRDFQAIVATIRPMLGVSPSA